ncbi:MAG: hypothetical protein HC860_14720 [Alkalinema sp. RU_4_3]|nr:hypothetical protein [Alkalinema sp. RU_4_3]
MKPNYSEMSWAELKAYALKHRDDTEALDAMYDRRSPDSEATWFSPPTTFEEWETQAKALKPLFDRQQTSN